MSQWQTLSDDEWATLSMLLAEWWPGEFTEASELAWRMGLDGHPAGDIANALKAEAARQALSADTNTRRWRPSLPEVLSHLVRDSRTPVMLEIVDLLWGPEGVMHARAEYPNGGFRGPDGRARADEKARLDAAVVHGPVVAAFVQWAGVVSLMRHDPSDMEPDDKGKAWGEANRAWLVKRFAEFCERADDRGVHAILASQNLDPLAELRRRANWPAALEESHG